MLHIAFFLKKKRYFIYVKKYMHVSDSIIMSYMKHIYLATGACFAFWNWSKIGNWALLKSEKAGHLKFYIKF